MKASATRAILILLLASGVNGQQTSVSNSSESQLVQAVQQLQKEVARLQDSVHQLRSESERYRAETQELERRLQAVSESKPLTAAASNEGTTPTSTEPDHQQAPDSASARLAKLEDEYSLLTGKVDDQYQTKIESGSRYRVRLSALLMLNLFSNRGVPDSLDTPATAISSGTPYARGSFAGSLRQSQIGLEIFGPEWAGAKVSGDLRTDFAGGFPDTENGVTLGLMRLRTGNVRLEWSHTALTAGQDAPMFSPLSPTSLIALAEPEFAYAGNLWTWVPQVQVQHWFNVGAAQRLSVAAGVLDPLTGETPRSQSYRTSQAGEASRQPGYSARIGWSSLKDEDRPLSFSAGGYFSRQDWGFNRKVNGWAATADWQIPLARRLALKGELYRGKALGGFGGGGGQSILSSNTLGNPSAIVRGLDTEGGWAQAGLQASPTLQFNAGYGLDNPFSNEIRSFASSQYALNPVLGRNAATMTNVIYRPRSDLLFSLEYRHLMSSRLTSAKASVENIGMGIGLMF
ncbi:MAG TPA: hypothetical protein VM912_05735 [Terriglobales bacterium]|nr:hypothetical protein [Terriglobales bacterium]